MADDEIIRSEQIDMFLEITHLDDRHTAEQVLNKCKWNLPLAVQEYLNHSEGRSSMLSDEQAGTSSDNSSSDEQSSQLLSTSYRPNRIRNNNIQSQQPAGWFQWCYNLLLLPFRFVYCSTLDLLWFVWRIFFPGHRPAIDAVGDVTRFIDAYELRFGSRHPTFYRGSYSMALNDAKRELKFLLVYLHSEIHQDTDDFCSNTLGDHEVIQFINHNMLFWGCSVKLPEGFRVHQAMRETTYPFLALICLRENRMMVILRKEGICSGPELIAFLAVAIQDNETYLNLARQEREVHQQTHLLRQEQEAAYMATLRQDEERERKKFEEQQRLAAIEQEEEMRKQDIERQLHEYLKKKAQVKENLPSEPDVTDPANIVRVSLKFPSGSRLERRFLPSDSLQLLYDVTFCHDDCPKEFSIVTNFPRTTLNCSTVNGRSPPTFAEANLHKSVMLYVLDNNS